MTKIIMMKTTLGCENGFTVREYAEGQEYDIAGGLAQTFINDGVAFESKELGDPTLPLTGPDIEINTSLSAEDLAIIADSAASKEEFQAIADSEKALETAEENKALQTASENKHSGKNGGKK